MLNAYKLTNLFHQSIENGTVYLILNIYSYLTYKNTQNAISQATTVFK